MKMNMLDKIRGTLERNEKIFEEVEAGVRNSEIAKKYGVSPGTPQMVHDNFYELKASHEAQLQYYSDIIELYQKNGKTYTEIADIMGTTKQNVSRILNICEVPRDAGGKYKALVDIVDELKTVSEKVSEIEFDVTNFVATKELVARIKEDGLTVETFAERHGLKLVKVRNMLKQNGLELFSNNEVEGLLLRSHVIYLRDMMKYTQVEIAEELEISQAYVSKILLDAGLRVRMSKDVYEKRDAEILKDHADGLDIKELMIKYDLKEVNVRRILYKEKEEVKG